MHRSLKLVLLLLLTSAVAMHAQSVRPAVVEYTAAAEGQYDVVNDSLLPLVVTMEAKSFTIDNEGVAKFTALSPAIHLQLSETSLRIPPRSHRTIYYKANAASYPAWFCIYSTFSGLPKRGSMNMELELPHTVYLLSKTEAKRDQVVIENLHTEAGELQGTVRNNSLNMIRLLSLQMVSADGKKIEEGGFPLLPGGERSLHLPFTAKTQPQALRAKLSHFTIEGQVK
jgi:P pilus assembly chaperone PapD